MAAAQELRSSELDDELLPRKFDRYDLVKKLATGGMAEIYLAKQSGLEGFEKVVVVKRILGNLAQDDEFVSMFLDEARIAAKLSHPNIVQIYDLGKADDTYYIAMEYVSGRNIQNIIAKHYERDGYIPVEHVCRIIAGVCDGLYYAHSRKDYDGRPLNIIHRDISPQNILVSFAGGVKVVDFGIAKASTQIAQTRAGVLKGKYAYMSPEQVRGAKIDHRSDIFAVGLVFYEMLTGVRAFERDSSLKTLKAIAQEKPVNPRDMKPDLPEEVVRLLSKALEKNPDKRYRTAQEMQLALEDYLESSPKKSNTVRISRYMNDLFDDEINSAQGTMVLHGVGEVIVPARSASKSPAISEEGIDHHSLSAALDLSSRGSAAPKARAQPASALKSDFEGLTSSDLSVHNGHGTARRIFEEESAHTAVSSPRMTGPGRDLPPEATSAPAHRAAPIPASRAAPILAPLPASMPASGDEAHFTAHRTEEHPLAPSLSGGHTEAQLDSLAEQDPLRRKPSLVVGSNGPVHLAKAVRPPARPVHAPPSSSTQDDPSAPGAKPLAFADAKGSSPAAAEAGGLPVLFHAAMAGVIGIFVLAIAGLIVLLRSLGPVEYGLVVVTTDPPHAHVIMDGEDLGPAPVQVPVPLGQPFTVSATMPGYRTAPPVKVPDLTETLLNLPPIVLEQQD